MAQTAHQTRRNTRSRKPPHQPFHQRVARGAEVLLVVRLRSGEHEKPKTRGAIRALGLRKGRWANLLPDAPSVWGSIHRIPEGHLSVHPFVFGSPEGRKLIQEHASRLPFEAEPDFSMSEEVRYPSPSPDPSLPLADPSTSSPDVPSDSDNGGPSVVTTKYAAGRSGKGSRFAIGDGASVRIERYEDRCTVVWPTDLGAAEFIRESRKQMHIGKTVMSIYIRGERDPREIDLRTLDKEAKAAGSELQIARLTDPELGISVGWQRSPRSPKVTEGAFSTVDPGRIDQMMATLWSRTGTSDVIEHTNELLGEIRTSLGQ